MATDGISTKQKKAIAAILTTSTQEEAAEAAGVGHRTLARWLAEDAAFRQELKRAEGDAIDAAVRRLVGLQDAVVNVFDDVLADPSVSPTVRLRAASAVIDYLLRLRELRNLEERLTALEERYAVEN